MAFQTNSSIAMALAGKTASVDIPQRRSGLSGGRVPTRPGQPAMLPTPPNSISPTLPPQTFKHRATLSPGSPLATVSLPVEDLDSTGAITPVMLAKYHLPEILLHQGPLAIRHVMGHLTTSVPGFSHIPPAKARRLVVAALEGRGNGGVQGDVVFEKVGWGRWDARRRGEPAHDRDLNDPSSPPSSVAGSFQQRGLQIQGQSGRQGGNHHPYRMSFAESTAFSYTDDYGMHGDLDMLEHEADKMSLDGDDGEYCSSSEAPDEMQETEWVEGDDTDEEDWAQIGADALRARSMNNNGSFINGHVAARAKPQPSGIFPATYPSVAKLPPRTFDIQERAAVEALLCLGSM
ncbi:hypothetical protein DTO013E5_1531 [Penicillium roqueforti]|nr:hypothetical protein DTO012A1_2058 [Penicillium roqueforti]KAI2754248.1 hypothetical protein DTO013F2_2074 [Penicillium roqueforti]KAI3216717.1 hypothetical protein DTO013E5_1531 [Penicillium roqueforti]